MKSNLTKISHVAPSVGPQARTAKVNPMPGGAKRTTSKVSVGGLNKGVKVTQGST